MNLQVMLQQGLQQLGIDSTVAVQQRWLAYIALLDKWNRIHNLTAIREPEKMLTHHLLDSLAIMPYLKTGQRLLDVGSGAGLPGIPLAIALPDMSVTMVDSNQKKTSFLRQVIGELSLHNAHVVTGRVESVVPTDGYEVITSRAFSEMRVFLELTRHLLQPGGRWYVMKGVYPEQELQHLPGWAVVYDVHRLDVPEVNAHRHLLIAGEKTT